MNDGFILKEKVAALEQTILAKHPSLPSLLAEIHKNIKANPEQITLLSEDDIKIIVNGLEIQTKTFLVQSVTKAPSKSKVAEIKQLGLDAF
jgi:hypothetical protein